MVMKVEQQKYLLYSEREGIIEVGSSTSFDVELRETVT